MVCDGVNALLGVIINFKLVWIDRKWDTAVSLDTTIEQFLAGQLSSDNTCKLRSHNRARELDVPKTPFSKAWSHTLGQLPCVDAAMV